MPRNVKIGNHVWITMDNIIYKGCNIEDNVIIGHKCICKNKIESNTVYTQGLTPIKKQLKGKWCVENTSRFMDVYNSKKIILVGYGKLGKEFYKKIKTGLYRLLISRNQK